MPAFTFAAAAALACEIANEERRAALLRDGAFVGPSGEIIDGR